jgi:hypothetical protein
MFDVAKLIKAAKRLDPQMVCLDAFTYDLAFEYSMKTSENIINKMGLSDKKTLDVLRSYIQLGTFIGYLSGWSCAHVQGFSEITFVAPPEDQEPLPEEIDPMQDLFTGSYIYSSRAKKYAEDVVNGLWQLLDQKQNLLLVGLSERDKDTLKYVYEGSLYSGFMGGVEGMYRSKPIWL